MAAVICPAFGYTERVKLAEALIHRADLKQRLAGLHERIVRNASQEGDPPAEDPNALLEEFERLAKDYEETVVRINRTNLSARLENGTSITEAIALRDGLLLRIGTYRKLVAEATVVAARGLKTEIKFVPSVDVRAVQAEADRLSRAHRELDARIQAANWTSDLLD